MITIDWDNQYILIDWDYLFSFEIKSIEDLKMNYWIDFFPENHSFFWWYDLMILSWYYINIDEKSRLNNILYSREIEI